MIKDLITKNRSCRRFVQGLPVERRTLTELIDLARLSPSAANLQPLKYILSCDPERNAMIFPHLAWAGYLKDWPGPPEGQRPAAYIIILRDNHLTKSVDCDHGIAAQSILLGAPSRCEILLVLALGKPAEKVVIEKVGPDGDIKYWRDSNGIHHVPKRPLDEIIIG